MKSYKKPEAEFLNIQLSEYCDIVATSSYEIDSSVEGGDAGSTSGGFQTGSDQDDL